MTPPVPKFVTLPVTARGTGINVPCFPVIDPIRFLAKSVGIHTYTHIYVITISWMIGGAGAGEK
jgi:hypothetical protein